MTTDEELMSSISCVYLDDARDEDWNLIPGKKSVYANDHGYDHEPVSVTLDEAIRFVELDIEGSIELLAELRKMKAGEK